MLVVNIDATHLFYRSKTMKEMTPEALQAYADQYAGSKVTHLFFCVNNMRASFRSSVRESAWDPAVGVEPTHDWAKNAKRLYERGIDPFAYLIERSRKNGISPWISMRMNDIHYVNNIDHPHHTEFWRNNRRLWRDPEIRAGKPTSLRALHYKHPEVREYQLAFVRELFERYDFDGLELDWMRWIYYLTPGKEVEEARFLTEFAGQVREIAREWERKRGHPIRIAARVPADPDDAIGWGMDATRWAKDGSIDLLIPTPFFLSDYDIPLRRWRDLLDSDQDGFSKNVALAPGFEPRDKACPDDKMRDSGTRGLYAFVDIMRFRGARNIYLYNWMDDAKGHAVLLEKGVDENIVRNAPRRYPVTYRDSASRRMSRNVRLPKTTGSKAVFEIPFGRKPESGRIRLRLELEQGFGTEDAVLAAVINGENTIPVADTSRTPGSKVWTVQFEVPSDSIRDDKNTVEIRQDSGPAQKIVWVELLVEP